MIIIRYILHDITAVLSCQGGDKQAVLTARRDPSWQ